MEAVGEGELILGGCAREDAEVRPDLVKRVLVELLLASLFVLDVDGRAEHLAFHGDLGLGAKPGERRRILLKV